jgi:hypothetical protein
MNMVLESIITAVLTVMIGVTVYAFSQMFSKFLITRAPVNLQRLYKTSKA